MGRKKKPTDEELKAQRAALEADAAALLAAREALRAENRGLTQEQFELDASIVGLIEANIALLRSKLERYEVRLAFHRGRLKTAVDSMTLDGIQPLAQNPTAAFDRKPDPILPETSPEEPASDTPAPDAPQ